MYAEEELYLFFGCDVRHPFPVLRFVNPFKAREGEKKCFIYNNYTSTMQKSTKL